MKEAAPTSVATPAKKNTPFFGKESGGDFFSGTDFFGDVQCCACEEMVQEKTALPEKDEEEALPEIQQVTEEKVPESLPAPAPEPAPVPAPAVVVSPVPAATVEEEETTGDEELQTKPIFESDIPPGDDIQRSCRECEEADVVYRSPTPGIQLLDDVKPDGSRESIIAAAKTMLGKIEAKNNDGSGKRVGAQYLLEIFHLAAPGVWDDSTIENIGGQLPSWCGIFAVWAHKKAGKNVGNWHMGKGVSAFHTLTQTTSPQPGDIGYIHQPFQHHCIVVRVEGDTVYSIDGNSGLFSEVKENVKPISNYTGFFTAFAGGNTVQTKLTVGEPDDMYEREAEHMADQVVQAKLTVGQPDDMYEREADSVADQVIQRMAIATPIQGPVAPVKVQRKPIFESNNPEYLQRKCAACEQKEELLQKKGGPSAAPASVETQLQSSKGSGSPLPAKVSEQMGDAMGADFSDIRIHTDSRAVQMNKELHAQAFTHGNHIYFNSGKYNTAHSGGQHLLAHELTHTIQQGAAGKVSKKAIPEPMINLLTAEEQTTYADEIYDWLEGWTSSADSAKILAKFSGLNRNDIEAILYKIAAKEEESITYVYGWLRSDCVTSDWKRLLQLFVQVQAPLINQLIATEVLDLLSGYTSSSNSKDICEWLTGPSGTTLDNILVEMEQQSGNGQYDMAEYLFGDLENMDAHHLSLQFVGSGGLKSLQYAIHWYAYKIMDLIAGWTSISDSDKILKNFQRLPDPIIKVAVYTRLDELSLKRWEKTAAAVLMDDMQMDDYNALRQELPNLPVYNIERNFWRRGWEFISNGADYLSMFLEYAVCGLVGVVAGIFDAIVSIVGGIIDIGAAILHLIGWFISWVSDGALCRESEEKVHEFFTAMGQVFDAPGDMISRMWEETKLEASLIQGPFQDCKQAIFWVRKVANFAVNVILIVVAGYGAVKAALEAIEALNAGVDFANVLAKIGKAPVALLRKMKQLPANLAAEAAKVVNFIRNIDETIAGIRKSIGIIRLAAQDENFYTNLRTLGKQLAKDKLEAEKEFWKERRKKWFEKADAEEGKIKDIETATDQAASTADKNVASAEAQAAKADADANATKASTDATEAEIKSGKAEPEKTSPVLAEVTTPDGLRWEATLNEETQAMLKADPELRKMWHHMDPAARRLLTYCASPCIPEGLSPANVSKAQALQARLNLGDEDSALREYLHIFRKDQSKLSQALDDLDVVHSKADLENFLDRKMIDNMKLTRPGWDFKKVDGLWVVKPAGKPAVTEFKLDTYTELGKTGTENFFEGHHGIQNGWAISRFGKYYDEGEAPSLLLRTRNFEEGARGTPHWLISKAQQARRAESPWATRTFEAELQNLKKDMAMINVPAKIQEKYLAQVEQYFGNLYTTMKPKVPEAELKALFGNWTPK
jgi:hypothetical protein